MRTIKVIIFIMFSLLLFSSYGQDSAGKRLPFYAHKKTFFMPYSYLSRGQDARDNSDLFYQLSLKVSMFDNAKSGPQFAYTQRSSWQFYDDTNSRPFRSTNYNPEFFYTVGSKLRASLGVSHESNGMAEPDSRGWSYMFLQFDLESSFMDLYLRSWYVFSEEQGQDEEAITNGRARSIVHYFGYGELGTTLKFGRVHFGVLGRYNTSTYKGAVEADLSYGLSNTFSFGFLYFNGYGDTLLDYNQSNTRYSVGILIYR